MTGNIPRLPDGELAIMQIIWDCGERVSRTEIEERLTGEHKLMPTTILTQLSRLTDKGFIRCEKSERKNLFTPIVTREEYLASQSESLFKKLCGGRVDVFAAALCDSGITKEELSELRRLLEEGEL